MSKKYNKYIKDATGKEIDKNVIERLVAERESIKDKIIQLETDINGIKNNTGGNYQNLSNQFHQDAKVKAHYAKTFGTTGIAYKDNIYKANINGTEYEITEEQ
ncbi:4208_t:CDS:2, partial [Racocetra fulgida]